MKKDSIRWLQIVLLVGVALFGANYAYGAWSEPPSSAPNPNAEAPLNVSPSGQIKAGGLTLNTGGSPSGLIVLKGNTVLGQTSDPVAAAVKLFAYGNVAADKYCDRNGQNCKTSSELGGGGGPTPTLSVYVKKSSATTRDAKVYCNPGDFALGGGPLNAHQYHDVHWSHPISASGAELSNDGVPGGWHCGSEEASSCYVTCLHQ